jgi:hypothetical protein
MGKETLPTLKGVRGHPGRCKDGWSVRRENCASQKLVSLLTIALGLGKAQEKKSPKRSLRKRDRDRRGAKGGPQDGTLVEARSRGGNPWNLPYSIANRLMNNGLFAQLSDAGSKLLGTVGENRFAFNTALRRTGFDSAGAMKDFKDYQQVQNEEMKNRLAALQLEKMIDSFQARIDGIALRVDDTNDYWDEYTEDSLTAAGFRREGTVFQKHIVTGSTITSPVIRELREIQQYQDMLYETPDLETASGIRNYGLVYDFDAVQALIANATKVVEAEEERVFGTGVREWRAKGGAWAERDEAPDLSKKKEQEKGWQNRGDGLFGKHVGYAPVYKSGYDVDMEKSRTKNIKYKGSGELGRILGYLSWYNMEEGAGYSQVNQPAWDKPLWDAYPLFGNEDWMMEAPSFAGAVDIVVQVVATVATAPVGGWGGAALGAAIGSVDDLLFTALELGTGYIIPEQALLQVGQTLLKAGVQTVMSGVMSGFGGADALNETATKIAGDTGKSITDVLASMDPLEKFGLGGLMGLAGDNWVGQAGAQLFNQVVSNTANGFIDAHSLEVEDGKVVGWHFDSEQWGEQAFGETAMFGYLGNVVGNFTEGFLNHLALSDGNGNLLPKYAYQDAFKFTDWVGSVVDQGIQSIHSGEYTFNLLNLGDIINWVGEATESDVSDYSGARMGLFEFGITSDGTRSRLGQSGVEVNGMSLLTAAPRLIDNPLSLAMSVVDELSGLIELGVTVGKRFSEKGRTELNLVTAFDRMGTIEGRQIASILAKKGVSTYDDPENPNNAKHSYSSDFGFMVSRDFISESGADFQRLTSEVLMQSYALGIYSGTKLDAIQAQIAFLDENLPEEGMQNTEFYMGLLEKMEETSVFEARLSAELLRKVGQATYIDQRAFNEAMKEGKTVTELAHLFLSEKDQIDLYSDLSLRQEFNDQLLQDYQIDFAYSRNILKASHLNYNDVKADMRYLMHKDDYQRYAEEGIIPLTSEFFPTDPQTEEERQIKEDYEANPEDYIHRLIPIGLDLITADMMDPTSSKYDPRLENIELGNEYFDNQKNLFHADIFISQNPDEKEALVAFRGTAQDNPMDMGLFGFLGGKILSWTTLFDDPGPSVWQYIFAGNPNAPDLQGEEWFSTNKVVNEGNMAEQYELGIELLYKLKSNDFSVLLTGHSQGGGEALFHSAMYGYKSVVYNPQSVHQLNLDRTSYGDYQDFSRVYLNSFDPLNGSQDALSGLGFMPRVHGRRNMFPGSTGWSQGDYSIDKNYNHSFIPFYHWSEEKMGLNQNYRRIR